MDFRVFPITNLIINTVVLAQAVFPVHEDLWKWGENVKFAL